MVSAFTSRSFGLGMEVSESEFKAINKLKRNRKHYISKESAITVNGHTRKHLFTETHLAVHYFDVGVEAEGYWSHDHICLQTEDLCDILCVKYPKHDFMILIDQSTGHKKRSEDSLNSLNMSVRYGGCQLQK